MQQVMIKNFENGEITGGLQFGDGDVLCGCCGKFFPVEKIGLTYDILEVYTSWKNISDAILEE